MIRAIDQLRTMTLTAAECLRRLVQHVLPRGFVRIHQSGYLAKCVSHDATRVRTLLAQPSASSSSPDPAAPSPRALDVSPAAEHP
jgi:hypothetical protein